MSTVDTTKGDKHETDVPLQIEDISLRGMEEESYGLSGLLLCGLLCTCACAHCILGFRGIFASRYVALCASFAAIGGLLFGYE